MLDKMKTRRSIRKFKSDMVPKDLIEKIVEAGTYAASGMNRQPGIIVAVTNQELRDQLSKMNAEIMGTNTDPFYGAPVVLIVLADTSAPTYLDDGSLIINYTSVADGYIDHHLDFDFGIIKFPGFQCMDREVLLLPKGTVIMSDNSLAIYCYNTVKYYKADQLEYSTYLSQSLGQTISPTKDVVPSSGTFVIKEDSIVRFSVRGKLSDVKIFPSKGNEDKVRLMNEIDCINECFK